MDGWYGRIYRGCGFFDADKPIAKFTKREPTLLLYKEPTRIKIEGINVTYEGLIPKIQKTLLAKDVDAMQPHIRAFVERAVVFTTCPDCGGTRLNEGSFLQDQRHQHRRCVCHADQRPGAMGPGLDDTSVAPLLASLRHTLDSSCRDRPGISVPGTAGRHLVRRGGTTHQDDPSSRIVAH